MASSSRGRTYFTSRQIQEQVPLDEDIDDDDLADLDQLNGGGEHGCFSNNDSNQEDVIDDNTGSDDKENYSDSEGGDGVNQNEHDSDDPVNNTGETDPPQKQRKLIEDKLVNSLAVVNHPQGEN